MGVEYAAAIVVGLPVSEFEDHDQIEQFGFEVVAPYYDGDAAGIAGIVTHCTSSYSRAKLDVGSIAVAIDEAKKEFKEATGKDATVYLSTQGY